MPLQSGSDRILQAMRRSYRREKYLGIIERVRKAIPNSTITTDIIVGFPGETEADFQETISLVQEARFLAAYTFQYSKRPGTPAATMENQISDEVMRERYERLHKIQQQISQEVNAEVVGSEQEILVADHEGRRDEQNARMSGRTKDFRLTHFAIDPKNPPRPGDAVISKITSAAPNFILADELPVSIRRTRGGAATEDRVKESNQPIMVGMPSLEVLRSKI
jgi:tRNA-2-methylthio-N6-dimethylallyladenosine synthase